MARKSLLPSLWSDAEKGEDIFTTLHDEIDRAFSRFSGGGSLSNLASREAALAPKIDVSETGQEIRISTELPGVKQEDLHVELCDDVLTISGEKKSEQEREKEEEGRRFHRVERSFGSFSRALRVPSGLADDDISASFKDGVLTVTVRKPAEIVEKTRKIEVKSS